MLQRKVKGILEEKVEHVEDIGEEQKVHVNQVVQWNQETSRYKDNRKEGNEDISVVMLIWIVGGPSVTCLAGLVLLLGIVVAPS